MRIATFGAIALGLLSLPALVAIAATDPYAEAARLQAGTVHTPSGAGDPNAIICRAPQPLPGGGMGPKSCMHNNVWARLTNSGQDLSADGKSVFDRPMVEDPSGEGIPDAVTCRAPQELPTGWHLKKWGPEICLTNATWAELKARRWLISADGKSVIDTRNSNMAIPGSFGSFGSASVSNLPAQIVH